ncbi:MAG: helix-turn-helix transcriptional regulator [Gammaproteobacteria bacterium]|nr:helix-turn-helix transcriptional regulator [Gammaproteobacteria bacterium]
MQDFASAAMVRLLVRAMRAHGLTPPPVPQGLEALQGSHVPLAYKRSVVESVLHQGGLGTLLMLAQRVDLLAGDPVHRALLGANNVPELLARWHRLERYVHSRHQVSIESFSPGTLVLRHHARHSAPEEPLPTESLAVLGVLMGASHALGVRGLEVEIGVPGASTPPAILYADPDIGSRQADLHARLAPLAAQRQTGHWTLRWETHHTGNPPTAPDMEPQPTTHLCDTLAWPHLAHQLARHVLKDPTAQHTVDALAEHAGLARRSLQRTLTQHSLSCRHIVTEARARVAAQWLLDTSHGLAEIGFSCGFADQPHFTREFARHVGMTPARYRHAFANGA